MSRCFPYPPPGYEPRLRSEHKDVLKKERRQGKKYRKENGREKGERKRREKRKGERKGKDRDHNKKLKREKRRERRKNKGRDKDNHGSLEQETQKTFDVDDRRPEERRKHEAVKDVKCLGGLIAQFPGQGGHPNHKVNSTSELIPGPGSSNGFGVTASKEMERSSSRSAKKSGHATQHCHGMIRKNDSNVYTCKKRTDAGVGSQTRINNGKNLQVGSVEKHSSRRHSSKVKQRKGSGAVKEQNTVDDPVHLTCLNEQEFACDDIKKRKELDANCTLHGNGMKTSKLPRLSPTNNPSVNGKTLLNYQGTNTQDIDQHKPQDGYSNGTTGSGYMEQQKVSVSSSVHDGDEGYLKPPHPDTKYLSQLLSIPPSEDTSECIDQDWLFSEDCVEENTSTFEAAGSHQVWSDAQLIHTADVVGLPYVVPL